MIHSSYEKCIISFLKYINKKGNFRKSSPNKSHDSQTNKLNVVWFDIMNNI